jgi:hypothetical protein
VQEGLEVPPGARQRRVAAAEHLEPERTRLVFNLRDRCRAHLGVADHAFAQVSPTDLELRLDQCEDGAALAHDLARRRQELAEPDERRVDHHEIDGLSEITGAEVARVGALAHDDPPIAAQLRMELSRADVDRMHARRAPREQAVGEAPRRGPEIGAHPAAHVDPQRVERPLELDAAPRDVGVIRAAYLQRHAGIESVRRLLDPARTRVDDARKDEGPRPLAARRKPSLDQQEINPLLLCGHRRPHQNGTSSPPKSSGGNSSTGASSPPPRPPPAP